MLVVGVTFRPVTYRSSSTFRSPSLSCFCNSSSPVIISCQSATVFVLVFVFVNVSTVSPLSFQYFTTGPLQSSVLRIYGPPLWILCLLFRLRLRYLFCFLSFIIFPGATWFSLSITVYSYLSISFFAFDIRCPCSPTCIFVPSFGLFYCRSPFHPSHPSTSIKIRFPLSIAASTVLQSL